MKNQPMKKIALLLVFSLTFLIGATQDLVKPPVWSFKINPKAAIIGQEVDLLISATFEKGWHLYGANFDPECGPIVTSVKWGLVGAEVVGDLESDKAKKKHDEIFGCDITYFDTKGEFVQRLKITSENVVIKGMYDCQLCQDDGMCIPFDGELNYSFDATTKKEISNSPKTSVPAKVEIPKSIKTSNVSTEKAKGCDTCCVYISGELAKLKTNINGGKEGGAKGVGVACDMPRRAGWSDIVVNRFEEDKKKESGVSALLFFLFGAFLSGLVALLTPCVFPMIPMTVTFFTKSSKTKAQGITNALMYGFFIIAIYTLIGVLVSKLVGPSFATEMATNWIVNMVFFTIFIVFSLSFLGLFEITLPSSFINKMDSNSDKGGVIGIFFMAFTIVLVSFSCTGPIVSSILVFSADGQWLKPIVGMFGYSLAFALPFGLFAAFPGWLNSLPKSGGWLNEVKVTLGLLELAFALKFLSQADQVENWGLLDREVFLSIWIAVFFVVAIYLMGKIRMKSDSPITNIGVFRMLIILVTFSFTIYMTPGLWGAPLKFLSGMLPPLSTQDFQINKGSISGEVDGVLCEKPLYTDQLHLPHGLKGYFDLRQAICCARQQNKPIFVDYTGKACANCREMEASVWSDERVLKRLREDYVIVALYGDYNKITLPEAEWYKNTDGKMIKTIGKSNSDLLLTKFGRQGQPFYLTLGVNEEGTVNDVIALDELTAARDFNKDIDAYIDFLDQGIKAFKADRAVK